MTRLAPIIISLATIINDEIIDILKTYNYNTDSEVPLLKYLILFAVVPLITTHIFIKVFDKAICPVCTQKAQDPIATAQHHVKLMAYSLQT